MQSPPAIAAASWLDPGLASLTYVQKQLSLSPSKLRVRATLVRAPLAASRCRDAASSIRFRHPEPILGCHPHRKRSPVCHEALLPALSLELLLREKEARAHGDRPTPCRSPN